MENPPLRVLRVIDRLNIGGPAKHVTWLTAGLDQGEYETLLVIGQTSAGEGDMAYFAHAAGIEPFEIDYMGRELSVRDISVVVKLVRLMIRFRPDIVHTHKSKAGAVARTAALLYRWFTPSALWGRPRSCRVVHTFHGHTFHGYFGRFRGAVFLGVERALARFLTDRIIVISEQQRREICEEFRVGVPSQYRVIPLGIDFGEITRQSGFRAELGVGANTHLIATVGRLCPIKNQQLFLEATRRVIESARGTDVRFVLVGDGELRGDLEQAARALGISEHVTFTGFRRDASHLYSEIDVMVLTSRNEGTPVTLIEAMSAGVAVISTEVGGVVDLLGQRHDRRDGVTTWDHGLTVASEDAEALARAIGRLLDDPELRQQMAERGRAFVLSRLSKDRLISDISNLYGELVDAPPNAGKMIVPFDASRMREGKGPSAR